MKRILNKWQIHWSFGREYDRMPERGWKRVSFGIFKLLSIPEQGAMISKRNYEGFLIRFYLWLPIDI